MGLDIGFYTEAEEEILALRNHDWLLERFLEQPHEKIDPYDDFYVTPAMVRSVLEAAEAEMTAAGMALAPLEEDDPILPDDMLKGIPKRFCDDEPQSWPEALPRYRLLLSRLLLVVEDHYVLICGWSA